MGEVYLAEDTKLGRKVAIKTLPADFTNDRERLRRFQHEARTASALNHPNILTIHEVDMEGGAHFIAAEFIDGDTLRTRIKRGRMKVEEALDVAQQSAFALTAAHGAGIIHRDIKPENIMVRHDGIVKVLDFGLAKLLEDQARNIDSEAETQVHTLTEAGRVMGTPAYMSPEQARGMELDARTDIWSLGVVLYEMVTGRPPFRGETKSHTVVSILETEPPLLNEFAPNSPPELQRIVRKALTKDRDSRYQTARDLMIDLKSLRRELDLQSELDRSAGASSRSNSTAAITARSISAAPSASALRARDARTDVGFYKRHKTLVIVGSIVLAMLLLGGIILSLAGFVAYWRARNLPPPQATINSIAVLPFANQNSDANSEYLSDGLTESIINSLSQLPNTRVLARTTVFRYKGQEADPHKVGSELGVDALLTGRVSQQGDTLIIQADLVRVRDGAQLWGARYHRKMADIFAVQSEIASEISQTLRVKLTSEEQRRVTKRQTENVEAYQWYLKGRYEASRFSPDAVPKAIEYFNRAIAADPNYAAPHAGLARIYGFTAHIALPPNEAYPRAKAEAEKALALDDQSDEGHLALSMAYLFYDWQFAASASEGKRALELNPNFAEAYAQYSGYFKVMRNYPEEIAQATKGRDLDPLSPFANMELGEAFYHARRYDDAIDQINKTLALDPNLVGFAYHVRSRAYEQKGMFAEAVADCRRWSAAFHDEDPMALATLAHAYAAMGNAAEAKKLLDQILKMREGRFVSAYWIGYVYAGMNDKDRAFEYFNKAIDERYFMMIWIASEPRFENLRSDSRFAELVRRVGLPQ
jgi:serine/threonine-protein kinase